VPELRRRIEDGQVVEYDECPVSFTEMKPDGSYAYCRMESARVPYEDYIAMGRVQQAAARQGGTIETDRRAESPSIFASCLPWLNYTSLTHPACTPADSNVRVSWGQLFMRCGMTQLSVSIQVHHALADGWHIARFYRALEEEITALCPTEENQ
jgi:chloramphenicol O-acetyltransferase type A